MPGLLKIGKSCRPVDERAQELSDSTGVPTNFIVAIQKPVSDCDAAELQIHRELAAYRVTQKREFFKMPLQDALSIFLKVAEKFLPGFSNDANDQDLNQGLDQIGDDGLTPLIRACARNDVAQVKTLLQNGADPNKPGRHGEIPLSVAAKCGGVRVTEVLLRHGSRSANAEEIAEENGHIILARLLRNTRTQWFQSKHRSDV